MSALAKQHLELPFDSGHNHYDALHNGAHGTAILWEKSGAGRWHKLAPGDAHIPALMAAQAGQSDRFISVNEFHGWRLVRLLKSLRALYIDIDGSTDLEHARELLRDARLPNPTAAVWSGRGLHLYWMHDPLPAKALPVWQRCQDALHAALAPMGADAKAKDCTRVLRLLGSVNSRSGDTVHGRVLDPQPYGWQHLADEILGSRIVRVPGEVRSFAAAQARRGERAYTGSIYDWWHTVYQDLLRIGEGHLLGGVPEGYRNDWLFLSAVALSWFAHPQTIAAELKAQARAWTPGLSASEVASALKQPLLRAQRAAAGERVEWHGQERDPRYWYRRSTLLEHMAPIIRPDMGLRAIITDDERAQHRREIEQARSPRDRVAEGRYATKKADSTERAKPWEALGISRRTYYNRKAAGTL